ncbi:MAG: sugar MFS transporter [Calditrichaeota bacterium]|nr:sugar MFS transporter [Calditrichota bacterium]MCB9369021.1 sugar MFS transporter [Calditrichota bacterium]
MQNSSYKSAFAIVTILFFMWGFLTCLNDILVPHLKPVFDLNYTKVMFIQFTFFAAYFLMSIPAGKMIALIGYQRGVVVGLAFAGVGALLFYPAAGNLSYPLFLTALFVLATGITVLQVAANPYAAVLGKPETASSRLNLAQAVNSLGHTTAPYLGGLLILGTTLSAEQLSLLPESEQLAAKLEKAASVQMPYLLLAGALFVLAIIMALVKLPKIPVVEDAESKHARLSDALKYRHLRLAAVGIFLYVGAEVSIGSFLVNFLGQPDIAGLVEAAAAGFVSYYWGSAMVGRFIGSALLQKMKPRLVLAVAATFASLLVFVTILSSGHVAMWTILAVGFFNSVMFPIIFTLGIEDLGPLTSQGSSVLVMAIVGGAIIPVLQGALADTIGIHQAFILPAVCYLYIIYYAVKGSHHPVAPAAR